MFTIAYWDMFEGNIKHHEARAQMWRDAGNEEYARCSDRKAEKWRQKRRDFDNMFGFHPKSDVEELLGRLLREAEERLSRQLQTALLGDH